MILYKKEGEKPYENNIGKSRRLGKSHIRQDRKRARFKSFLDSKKINLRIS